MYRPFTVLIFLLLALFSRAQPQPNGDCSTASLLCAQQALSGNNTGVVNTIPNQCQPTEHMLWYTFTTNSQGGAAQVDVTGIDCPNIPGVGDELAMVVLAGDGSCAPAQFTVVESCTFGTDQISVTTGPLQPDTQYWIVIAGESDTNGPAECEFEITVGGEGVDVLGVDLIVSGDVEIGIEESTQLNVEGGSGHVWSPTSGLSNANIADPIASPSSTTTYTVTVEEGGCTYTAEVLVEVVRRIIPTNTFTPNGDGRNDFWTIPGIVDYPGAEVLIFDRWGQRVYASTGYREPWDGTNNGARLPDGTYYYHIQLNQLEGRSPPYTGFISIIR